MELHCFDSLFETPHMHCLVRVVSLQPHSVLRALHPQRLQLGTPLSRQQDEVCGLPHDYRLASAASTHEYGLHAGFRSTRRTKIICTIGPTSASEEMLQTLAINGMNVARLNMCHGTHEWHRNVIARIRKLNKENGCA